MQALKGLVALLTILIIVMMTAIAYGLYRKSDDPDFRFFSFGADNPAAETTPPPAPPAAAASPAAMARAFGEVMVSLPRGCSVAAVSGDGVRIFLNIGPAGGDCERVIVVDAASGSLLGTLKVSP